MKLDMLGNQAFVAVADGRTFREAAQSLHITQAALSRRLQTFEAFLGVNLIERTTRSSSLSSTGRGFLPQARRLIGIDTIDLVDPVVSRPMVLLTHRGAHLSPAAQALYDMVRRARSA